MKTTLQMQRLQIVLILGLILHLHIQEWDMLYIVFSLFIASLLFSLLFLVTQKLKFSLLFLLVFEYGVWFASHMKNQYLNMPLYLPDFKYFFRLSMWEVAKNYVHHLFLPMLACVLMAVLLYIAWKRETQRRVFTNNYRVSLIAAVLLFVFAETRGWGLTYLVADRMDRWTFLSADSMPLTIFYFSSYQTRIEKPKMGEKSKIRWKDSLPLVNLDKSDYPDIFVVLEESTFEINKTKQCQLPQCKSSLFAPDSQTISWGPLGVHVFGGGTWLSEFAFFTGFPHTEFGPGGIYAPFNLVPFVKKTFLTHLQDLGYYTIVIHPEEKNFLNAETVYPIYGFDEVYSSDHMHYGWGVSDQKIFSDGLKFYEKQKRRNPHKPVFLFLLTIAQHGPHDSALAQLKPEIRRLKFKGLDSDTRIEIANYLDRLRDSERGMTWLQNYISKRQRPAILLQFGDHHPGFQNSLSYKDDPRGFPASQVTYFKLNSYHRPLIDPQEYRSPLDIAFLGSELLKRAGLPLNSSLKANQKLKELCDGIFTCPDHPRYLASYYFHLLGELKVIEME